MYSPRRQRWRRYPVGGQAGALVDHLAQQDVVKFRLLAYGTVPVSTSTLCRAHRYLPGGILGPDLGGRHVAAEQRDTVAMSDVRQDGRS